MKFNSPAQIRLLADFKGENLLTTSFYLDTDKSRQTKKEIAVSFKNLLSEGRTRLAALDVSKAKKDSLVQDLDRIARFGAPGLSAWTAAGLALYACSGAKFWEEMSLPRAPRNHIIFDRSLYVRPLSSMLDEYRRICALLLDRQEARWHEIFMGEISLLDTLKSEVPSRVREGGWQGYESKRIERHIDAHLHDHFKKAALKTFDLFKKNTFDWLFLSCKEEYRSNFEPLLHPYLKERLKGWLKSDSNISE
ncbi:MAG: Peptide chain release factor 1 (eRF1)-like protein, partial [Candidatus Aminicenantes bacterium]|nr:Peptide chain release factor 1 (eRF1)-like protein [Candidatus Aminicenantes bacterium]